MHSITYGKMSMSMPIRGQSVCSTQQQTVCLDSSTSCRLSIPEKRREGAGDLMSNRSRSFMRGLLAGDSGGGGENSRASVGPPECSCCRSSQRDTQRSTSLHTVCNNMQYSQTMHCLNHCMPLDSSCCDEASVVMPAYIIQVNTYCHNCPQQGTSRI